MAGQEPAHEPQVTAVTDVPETPRPQRERDQGRDGRAGRVDPGACPVSAPHPWGVLHLLVADGALTEAHVYRCYLALCGELLPTSGLPPSTCPDDCEFDVLYCTECVRRAAQWTAEAQQAERASGTLR
jgi:hypothetical protein